MMDRSKYTMSHYLLLKSLNFDFKTPSHITPTLKPEAVFLDVIGTKLWRLIANHCHLSLPTDFTPPPMYGCHGLEISRATAESGWGLGFVFIIFLFTFEGSIVL
jgi:hypothetical protein